jgi:hypothetical protein
MIKAEEELSKQGIEIECIPAKKKIAGSWIGGTKESRGNPSPERIETYDLIGPIFKIINDEGDVRYSKSYLSDTYLEGFVRFECINSETIIYNLKFIRSIEVGVLYAILNTDYNAYNPDKTRNIIEDMFYFAGIGELKEYKK